MAVGDDSHYQLDKFPEGGQQMNKEELQKMKCRELFKLATSMGIKGAWDMKKAEVIEATEPPKELPETTT